MIGSVTDNMGTIIITALLLAAVILACVKIYKDKRAGKSSCGGNCGGCPFSSECAKDRNK